MRRRFLGIPFWVIGIGLAYVFREKLGIAGVFDKLKSLLSKKTTSTTEG